MFTYTEDELNEVLFTDSDGKPFTRRDQVETDKLLSHIYGDSQFMTVGTSHWEEQDREAVKEVEMFKSFEDKYGNYPR